jgi:hypothetical protein
MTIPQFDADGNLPPGIHQATWNQVAGRFGSNARRRELLAGLREVVGILRAARCRTLYLDGSFVTAKPIPADFDACWDTTGVALERLDPVLLTFDDGRAAQKARFGGELFPATFPASPGAPRYLDFFQLDRATGQQKGIIALDLRRL